MTFHIEYPRVVPARRPEGHQPAAPRYTLRWEQPIAGLVSDYFAVQGADLGWSEQRIFFDSAIASFAGPDGPCAHEIMRFRDEAGEINAVIVGYWANPTAHGRWSASSELVTWLTAIERLAEPTVGYWRETISVPYDRHETIYSASWYRIGLARLPGSSVVPMTTNGYFGAARDRLPISAIDLLESPLKKHPPVAKEVSSRGRRLRAVTPHNLCALRSGQFWEGAGKEQADDYYESLQPKLMRGMDYLINHKSETGTLSLRIMTNVEQDGRERAETSVLAYFLSLEQLELWAKSHETHLAIYSHAIAANRKFKEKREVVTWHEVFVLPTSSTFEYINCHPKTGFIPLFPLLEYADR